jgi:hypothetical protein
MQIFLLIDRFWFPIHACIGNYANNCFIRLGLFLLFKTYLLEENTVNTLFSFNALQNIINKCNLLTLKVVVKLTILFYLSLLFMILQINKMNKCNLLTLNIVSFFNYLYIVKQNMNILQITCFIQIHIHLNINH